MSAIDFEKEFRGGYAKPTAKRLIALIGADQEQFNDMAELIFGQNEELANRAAFYLRHVIDAHPFLIEPFLPRMILALQEPISNPVKRFIVAVLQDADIPEEHEGILADKCFQFLNSAKETIAVKVFSMTVLFRIVKKYPELKMELEESIRTQLPYGSAGFKSRGQKILKALEKIQ